jgi:hypothetical protein
VKMCGLICAFAALSRRGRGGGAVRSRAWSRWCATTDVCPGSPHAALRHPVSDHLLEGLQRQRPDDVVGGLVIGMNDENRIRPLA